MALTSTHSAGSLVPALIGDVPVDVAGLLHRRLDLRPLLDDHHVGLVLGALQGAVDDRLVLHHPGRLDAARRRHHDLRAGVVDADRELVGGEPAEHHRVHRPEARAGQHRDHRLRDHRQVDHHPVTRSHSAGAQRTGEGRHPLQQLGVAEPGLGVRDGAVVDQRGPVAVPADHVAVERVEAGVQRRVGEPAVERRVLGVEDLLRLLDPVDQLGLLRPVALRVLDAPGVFRAVVAHDPILVIGAARGPLPDLSGRAGRGNPVAPGGRRVDPVERRPAVGPSVRERSRDMRTAVLGVSCDRRPSHLWSTLTDVPARPQLRCLT